MQYGRAVRQPQQVVPLYQRQHSKVASEGVRAHYLVVGNDRLVLRLGYEVFRVGDGLWGSEALLCSSARSCALDQGARRVWHGWVLGVYKAHVLAMTV